MCRIFKLKNQKIRSKFNKHIEIFKEGQVEKACSFCFKIGEISF